MGDLLERIYDVPCQLKETDGGKCIFYGELNFISPLLQNFGNWQAKVVHLALDGELQSLPGQFPSVSLISDFCLDSSGRHLSLACFNAVQWNKDKSVSFESHHNWWIPVQVFKGSAVKIWAASIDEADQVLKVKSDANCILLLRLRVFTSSTI
jgi:hypothetical protein